MLMSSHFFLEYLKNNKQVIFTISSQKAPSLLFSNKKSLSKKEKEYL